MSVHSRWILSLVLGCAVALSAAGKELRTITVELGPYKVRAEVADSRETRAKGLMHRERLGKDDGMVFVFDEPGYHSMWMMNTLIPLAVAFIDAEGRILNIREMQPHSQDMHTAEGPARYALEMNTRWFSERGIKAGDKVKGLPPIKPTK
jgi:hypothetical protein